MEIEVALGCGVGGGVAGCCGEDVARGSEDLTGGSDVAGLKRM